MKFFTLFASLCLMLFSASLFAANAKLNLNSKNSTLIVKNQSISLKRNKKNIIQFDAIKFNYTQATKWDLISADENTIILKGEFPANVDFYKHVNDEAPRFAKLIISKVKGGFRFYSKPSWGRQTTLTFSHLGDHFFGLSEPLQPDNQLSPDLTASSIVVEVNSEGAAIQENYASAFSAFYMSSFGYGAFFDTFARGRYDFAINGHHKIHHDTGVLDWYVFPGDNGADIHTAYFDLIGQPKPVPAWGLGPVGWRDQNDGGAAEIVSDIEKMNALKIPFTSWFVDRPYSDGAHAWSQMNFNKDFANPSTWIGKLRHDFGLEFMTWTATSTFGDARFEKHLGGKFSYLDLSHPGSVKAFQSELKKKQYSHGVKGHKIDRADESFADAEDWHDANISIAERRNKYAYLIAKVHDESLREAWGDDQITFTRTAIHRAQPYLSAIWAGDPRTSWEGLQANFANAARSSFMGFPVWGTDVGGYQGEGYIPEDLYIRWMQAASMAGLFEIKLDGAGGDGRDRMPWRYDEKFQKILREICEERMQFVPYLYSLSRTSGKTGTLMQPLAYRHLTDSKTYNIWDQYYAGDAILVAPIFQRENKRNVYLPKGNWRDFDNLGTRYKGNKTISIKAPLEKLPRFVKENSLYVTGNIYLGNDRLWSDSEKQLTIHALPGAKNSHATFTYVDMLDANAEKIIQLERKKKQVVVMSPALTHKAVVEIVLDKAPKRVLQNKTAANFNYNPKTKILAVTVLGGNAVNISVSL